MCGSAISKLCHFSTSPPMFNETIGCIRQNFATLEADCSLLLDVFISGIYRSCGSDILGKCQSSLAAGSPTRTMACLAWNFKELTPNCKSQLDEMAGSVIPCGKESSQYCSDKWAPEEVFDCLSASTHIKEFSTLCYDMVIGYDQCKIDDASAGGGGGGGGGHNGGGIRNKNKPSPDKPSPDGTGDAAGGNGGPPSRAHKKMSGDSARIMENLRLRRRLQGSGNPKPRPGQDGGGTRSKEGPGGEKKRPGQDGGGVRPKKNGGGGDEEKPRPGKQKPCWSQGDSIEGGGGGGDNGEERPGKSSGRSGNGGTSSSHGGNANGSIDSTTNADDYEAPPEKRKGPLPALIAALFVAIALVLVYRYRDKIFTFVGGRSDVSAPPAASRGGSSDVELSTYIRASSSEEGDDDFEDPSSSHPLAQKQQSSPGVIVLNPLSNVVPEPQKEASLRVN